ncbi:AraC family transcriptional regulator [Chloroflexi bacterium TSY]|nr:AraC family transcriptional regulator [Chloroflexi bacterium TSY]
MIDYKPEPLDKPYYLVHGTDNTYYACRSEEPLLSLKCMFNGPATYETDDGRRFVVDDSSYLILNHQQPYTMVKDAVTPIESFCIFFSEELFNDVQRTATEPDLPLLDEPSIDSVQPVHFFEKIYPHDDLVSPYIHSIRSKVQRERIDKRALEETMHGLLISMMQTQRNLFREIEQLPAARYSTRVELYQRLHHARDYMHASLAESLSLADIAQVVHLSPHHFLRSFKEAFGITPHAYLIQKRIERAQYLLAHTTHPVTEICLDVGFESLSSFSNLFRRETGLSPRAYRQETRILSKV